MFNCMKNLDLIELGLYILGLTWLETLGTFILNVEKKLTFYYKNKKIMFSDITMTPPLLEDFKNISKMIK
jgi:hypothetical protein